MEQCFLCEMGATVVVTWEFYMPKNQPRKRKNVKGLLEALQNNDLRVILNVVLWF